MKFTNFQFARDYDTRMSLEGYPGMLLDIVIQEIHNCTMVIDIGAGSGHFAIPFARKGYSVTAIEPSAAMMKIFKEKIRNQDFQKRIKLDQCRWEDWRGQSLPDGNKATTAALCAYAIYGIPAIQEGIEKMLQYARTVVILIGNDEASDTLSGTIRKALALSSCARKSSEKIVSALEKIGIPYKMKEIMLVRRTIFGDIEAEADYFIRHLGVSEQYKAQILKILRKTCRYSDPEYHATAERQQYYYFDNTYRDIMFVLDNS